MSSGSYFPPPVRTVEIPKSDGGKRALGIPTVADRIAQMVVKMYLEPLVEPHFHQDSYGYRPGKSAIQAVGVARQRCWRLDWALDLDIKGFFDNLDHALLMRAVRKHTDCRWIILYIERWLKAPAQLPDGTLVAREQGTPQGGVISPLLANLFLHYAFDVWMQRHCAVVSFERYADDIIVHCKSEKQAFWLKDVIARRLAQCQLELHPEKPRTRLFLAEALQSMPPGQEIRITGRRRRRRISPQRSTKHDRNLLRVRTANHSSFRTPWGSSRLLPELLSEPEDQHRRRRPAKLWRRQGPLEDRICSFVEPSP